MDYHEAILKLLSSPKYQPLRKTELARQLRVPDDQRNRLRRTLMEMVSKGEIVQIRKERFVLPEEADLVTGKILMNERGFGFVVPDRIEGRRSIEEDIFIPAENAWIALHNDRVVVRLSRGSSRRDRRDRGGRRDAGNGQRLEGAVIRILERANETIVGTVQQSKMFHYVVPDDPRMIHNFYVQPALGAKINDKVVVRLAEWRNRHVNPEGEIIEVLGKADDPGVDMISIIKKFHLPLKFPDDALREAENLPDEVPESDLNGREDLRNEFIVTIDPDDARDYDDAVHVIAHEDGSWTLGVHIADVSHYVQPKTALDREALKRGNSTYLADRVIPMLPEKLSNGLCSLKEGVPRLTKSAFIKFTKRGVVKSFRFANTVIQSRKRLTYKQALAMLMNEPVPQPTPGVFYTNFNPIAPEEEEILKPEIRKMWKLASTLRKKRFAEGSLDLDFPEVKVRLDAHGRPVKLEKMENDISHQLIEEFMLAANEAVAKALKDKQTPSIYRIHEDPDEEKLNDYREFVQTFGIRVGDLTKRGEVQHLLKQIGDHPHVYTIKLNLLKSLKRAVYSADPIGHYGLSKTDYTHFTSPIRRYADLIVHRVLDRFIGGSAEEKRKSHRPKKALKKSVHPHVHEDSGIHRGDGHHFYDRKQLQNFAEHISTTERNSAEAEKESVKLKILQYFHRQLETGMRDTFEAVILEIKNYGFFVELVDSLTYGLVHVSSLEGFYRYDETRLCLVSKNDKQTYSAGMIVKVEVDRVDLFKRQIDFRIVD